MRWILVLAVQLFFFSLAQAEINFPPGPIEFQLGGGATQVGGDFSNDTPFTTSYQINLTSPTIMFQKDTRNTFGYLAVSGDFYSPTFRGSGTPFAQGQTALVNRSGFGPYLCIGNMHRFQPCLGILLNILLEGQNTPNNIQQYGEFSLAFNFRYILSPCWLLSLNSGIFSQSSTISGNTSGTSFWTTTLNVGWSFAQFSLQTEPPKGAAPPSTL